MKKPTKRKIMNGKIALNGKREKKMLTITQKDAECQKRKKRTKKGNKRKT
jgi:hypothetical protein